LVINELARTTGQKNRGGLVFGVIAVRISDKKNRKEYICTLNSFLLIPGSKKTGPPDWV
jgi:hypothetical protein